MISFEAAGERAHAYLALPTRTPAPGVLVLHAWWGLTPFFKQLCDRLAQAGYAALAPDLYGGATADTIEAAQALLSASDFGVMGARADGALAALRQHPAVRGPTLGALGCSLGAAYALALAGEYGAAFGPVVLFYGVGEADFSATSASFQGHFAEHDEWEPSEGVHQMADAIRAAGRVADIHIYPGVQHWFIEQNRPEYDAAAAALAWQRTLGFLAAQLAG